MPKTELTDQQKKNRKQGAVKTLGAQQREYQRRANDKARREAFFEGLKNK